MFTSEPFITFYVLFFVGSLSAWLLANLFFHLVGKNSKNIRRGAYASWILSLSIYFVSIIVVVALTVNKKPEEWSKDVFVFLQYFFPHLILTGVLIVFITQHINRLPKK